MNITERVERRLAERLDNFAANLYIGHMSDDLDIRRKRLLFRSWRRGTRESDLLLGSFAERYIERWGVAELDRYEALLDNSDADIFDWISGRAGPPADEDTDILRLLSEFRYRPSST